MDTPHTPAIELARRMARNLVLEIAKRDIELADVTIGLAYALHDTVSELTGDHASGVRWMQEAAVQMGRQLKEAGHGKPTAH